MSVVSSEWLLKTKHGFPNGGSVILLRALLTSLIVYTFILILRNALDPSRAWTFSVEELQLQLVNTMHWFGAMFAVTYTAFYTRFASQWTYLANVYNQIKAAECRCSDSEEARRALAEWKAGFLEDAEELHLAAKPLFASVVRAWGSESIVAEAFVKYVPGGQSRLSKIFERAEAACERIRRAHAFPQNSADVAATPR